MTVQLITTREFGIDAYLIFFCSAKLSQSWFPPFLELCSMKRELADSNFSTLRAVPIEMEVRVNLRPIVYFSANLSEYIMLALERARFAHRWCELFAFKGRSFPREKLPLTWSFRAAFWKFVNIFSHNRNLSENYKITKEVTTLRWNWKIYAEIISTRVRILFPRRNSLGMKRDVLFTVLRLRNLMTRPILRVLRAFSLGYKIAVIERTITNLETARIIIGSARIHSWIGFTMSR